MAFYTTAQLSEQTFPQEDRLPLQVWHPISLTRLVSLLSSAPFHYFVCWSQHGSGVAHQLIYFRATVYGSKSSTGFHNNSKNVSSTRENFVPKHFIFPPHLLLSNLFSLFVFTVKKKSDKVTTSECLFIWTLPIQIHTEGLLIKQNLFPGASLN